MVKIYAGTVPDLTSAIFSDLSYKQHVYNPNTISFQSTKKIGNGTDIRVLGNFPDFGGKINDSDIGDGIHSYEAIDYSDLLRGKIKGSFSKKSRSYMLKSILKSKGLKIGGIKNTKKKYDSLIFKDVKAIDACHQICNLENDHHEFFVNSNGIGVFKKIPQTYKGIVLRPGHYEGYSTKTDTSNIITEVKVYGKKDAAKLLYSYKNKPLSAKYGVITELIIDDNIKTKAKAKAKAKQLFQSKGRAEIEAVLTIPAIKEYKPLKPGDWIVVYDKSGNMKTLFIEEMTYKKGLLSLKLMSEKTPAPESWTYKPPDSKSKNTCSSNAKGISPPKKVEGSCKFCKQLPTQKNTFVNKCPHCGKKGKLKFNYGHNGKKKYNYSHHDAPEGQFTCDPNQGGCGADYCAKCGYEKVYKKKYHLTKVSGTSSCSVAGVNKNVSAKAKSLGSACKIFKWIKSNIKYAFYYDNKYSAYEVMTKKKGNCADQSRLLIDMLKSIGIIGTRKHTKCPYRGGMVGHYNVSAKVNGMTRIIDTVSSNPANKHKGAWTRTSSC
ncbi:prophage endopeptidase tail [Methanobrevibacter cuticularis]|uniref:Prophage endopeptidase tail n=1 Tax=Methanobrevibacter cuticularis TaxID=47311 RepID=A0A166EHA5_9EURY|nr:transglutaminase-like domain-containing protein [Methanobrevibacter cuticularis]KZX16653.1 prophage endopeptidase tail [Methanobrevibacter cuticularis]